MFFVTGTSWQLGVLLLILANLCLGGSLVIYDSLLCRIAEPDERDRVSSRGWALGYLGGGLLLALNLVLVTLHDTVGSSEGGAVRVSLLSAGLWWAPSPSSPCSACVTLRGTTATPVDEAAGVVGGSLRQLVRTFAELGPTRRRCCSCSAYLFYNDGIQTVITSPACTARSSSASARAS